ncbi:MAG: metalloregulator ArsR/SmtB family transcription factor [Ilumatobacter sp.]|uniref:ArsR/SmtB family transcription factor n=1 Tax=Ilumatobacter sp. TaxID=1967498 RepID=UPI00261A627D|nr:metalloregulator ArsR/SmtB family transcription factor [Ilumatobacter sp.]MDJ0768098.1 metalloregulator ArsR/SmtB family transcription factor [Ilumatobacter sp.]
MSEDERFRALANPTRRRLLRIVRDDARTVGDLASSVGASQPATSQHLGVLREAGLVSVEQRGRCRLYRADHAALREAQRFFEDYWSKNLDVLADVAERRAARRSAAS